MRTSTTTRREPKSGTQAAAILASLRTGRQTVYNLVSAVGSTLGTWSVPEPSIRRAIGSLRAAGYDITNSRGFYNLNN